MASQKITDEQRHQMIADAAYFRAERRGFHGGDPVLDWVDAEADIDARLQQQQHDALLAILQERLDTLGRKLESLRKQPAADGTSKDAAGRSDLQILGQLHYAFEQRLGEIRKQGRETSQQAKEEAEKIWNQISEVLGAASSRRTTQRRAASRSEKRASTE
jgi:hypothetical protein